MLSETDQYASRPGSWSEIFYDNDECLHFQDLNISLDKYRREGYREIDLKKLENGNVGLFFRGGGEVRYEEVVPSVGTIDPKFNRNFLENLQRKLLVLNTLIHDPTVNGECWALASLLSGVPATTKQEVDATIGGQLPYRLGYRLFQIDLVTNAHDFLEKYEKLFLPSP